MPIVTVEIVGAAGAPPGLARTLADAIGRALGSPAGGTWVRLRLLDPGSYAENETPASDTPAPVFVTIEERDPPQGDALAARIAALTESVARACGRDRGLVHVEVAPPSAGRRAFGGRIVR